MSAAPVESAHLRAPLAEGLLCPDCGYDLRGLTGARCPECGFDLDAIRAQASRIPWSRRCELGWLRAYWQTVWLVIRWPRRFCIEMARPVSYADSQSFRWATTLHVAPPFALALVLLVIASWSDLTWDLELTVWYVVSAPVITVLYLVLLPGLASYFYRARSMTIEHQNRAIALSYYAWAPVAVVPAVALLYAGSLWAGVRLESASLTLEMVVFVATISLLVVLGYLIFLVERRLLRIAQYTLHRGWLSTILRIFTFHVAALGLALGLLLTPAVFFYLLVVWHSLDNRSSALPP